MSEDKIAALKILAKEIKVELGIKHQQALDEASRRSGYVDYHHARKILLDRPHQILFGIDLKYFLDVDQDWLNSKGLSVRYDYWDMCHEAASDALGMNEEDWRDENDWVALSATPVGVKSIKDAIQFVRELFFHPPEFVLFDGVIVDLSTYVSSNYLRFDVSDDEEEGYYLTFLQEDFQI